MSRGTNVQGQDCVVAHSSGHAPPATAAPWGATDCHHHIADARFPKPDGRLPVQASVQDYQRLKQRLGITRSVVVAAASYGDDARVLVDALRQLGTEHTRGVALVYPEVSEAELDRLHAEGVRGIRVYLGKGRVLSSTELRETAARAHARGWHLQFVAARQGELVAEWEALLASLDCTLVFDHFGFAPQPAGERSATAGALKRLLDRGHTYTKLSGVYIQSREGYPAYSDVDALAVELIAHASERMLWGTDWPHPNAAPSKPDDALVFDQLARWAPSEQLRRQILVDNPDRVYWRDR